MIGRYDPDAGDAQQTRLLHALCGGRDSNCIDNTHNLRAALDIEADGKPVDFRRLPGQGQAARAVITVRGSDAHREVIHQRHPSQTRLPSAEGVQHKTPPGRGCR